MPGPPMLELSGGGAPGKGIQEAGVIFAGKLREGFGEGEAADNQAPVADTAAQNAPEGGMGEG